MPAKHHEVRLKIINLLWDNCNITLITYYNNLSFILISTYFEKTKKEREKSALFNDVVT